jgi:rare lipoprotein A (peptidoglycan hydrolase)
MKKLFSTLLLAQVLSLGAFGQESFTQEGIASYTSDDYHGSLTKSGQVFDNTKNFAAHPFLPMGSSVRVTNLENNKFVDVKIVDRCACQGRSINVSKSAAAQIGLLAMGKGRVRIETIGTLPNETEEVRTVASSSSSRYDDYVEPRSGSSRGSSSTGVVVSQSPPQVPIGREFKEVPEETVASARLVSSALPVRNDYSESLSPEEQELATVYKAKSTSNYSKPATVDERITVIDNKQPVTPSRDWFNNEGTYTANGEASLPRGVGLQVGVFSTEKGLKTICEDLERQGIAKREIFVQVLRKDAGKLYKVLVGSYENSSSKITEKLRELSSKGYKALVKNYL